MKNKILLLANIFSYGFLFSSATRTKAFADEEEILKNTDPTRLGLLRASGQISLYQFLSLKRQRLTILARRAARKKAAQKAAEAGSNKRKTFCFYDPNIHRTHVQFSLPATDEYDPKKISKLPEDDYLLLLEKMQKTEKSLTDIANVIYVRKFYKKK